MSETDVYQELCERVKAGESKLVRRAWEMVVTPEEADMLLALPAEAEDLAEKFNLDVDTVKERMEELVLKGAAIPVTKEGRERYFLPRSVGNFFESASHVTYEIVGDELLDIWSEWLQTEWLDACRLRWEKNPESTSRVFPITGAVKDRTGMKYEEDIWARVEEARKIAVVDCPCRLSLKKCDHTLQACMLFDVGADLALRRESGRELSKKEAHELMKAWAEEGLIAQGANRAKLTNLCWCCTDCCLVFYPQLTLGIPIVAPSRYQAVVDQEACTGCQDCVDRCPVEAIEMLPNAGSKKLKAFVDVDKCLGCGVCAVKCPADALTLNLVRPEEHLPA